MNEIVVTGGSSGVGAALVARLLAAGHPVISLDVQPPLEACAAQWVECNLGDAASIQAAVGRLPAVIGGLANVAGIARAADPVAVLAVNFLGMRELTRQLTPRLLDGAGIVC